LTWSTLGSAHRLGLQTVLWSTWGRDWRAVATGPSVVRDVTRHLTGGGTILLHDSDCTSAPGSWRSTLASLDEIVGIARARDLEVGPLRDHGIGGECERVSRRDVPLQAFGSTSHHGTFAAICNPPRLPVSRIRPHVE
jgi:hypothetical protein